MIQDNLKAGLKMNTLYDMYRWYIAKMLRENPSYWTEYDKLIRRKNIHVLFKKNIKGEVVVHMTYTWFRAIIEKNNTKAKEYIINGYRYKLGPDLGYILARRVERNFSKPKVDVIATMKYRKETGLKTTIYFTDDDYCRIAWHKLGRVRNESVYLFKPCKEFRLTFSQALIKNTVLKFKYLFFPFLKPAS